MSEPLPDREESSLERPKPPPPPVEAPRPPGPPPAGMVPFGPAFFETQLAGFVRERCPDPGETRPVVELHLHDGTVLDVCHVIGLTPLFVALAVLDRDLGEGALRTELVPYASVLRVTFRVARPGTTILGFDPHHRPTGLDGASSPVDGLAALALPLRDGG